MFGLVVEEGVDGSIVSRAFEVAFGTLDTALWPFIALQSSQRLESRKRTECPVRMVLCLRIASRTGYRVGKKLVAGCGAQREHRTLHALVGKPSQVT